MVRSNPFAFHQLHNTRQIPAALALDFEIEQLMASRRQLLSQILRHARLWCVCVCVCACVCASGSERELTAKE